ncbi:MAG: NRDE family protein [Gammaproteobacteria bacterium]
MCLLLLAWNAHPDYPFVFAGNRDEMHTRATRQAHWWEDVPEVLGGRDLQAGGSWLGIGRDGRFAVVTNYRDGRRSDKTARSRGLLVSDFLASSQSPEEFTALLDSTAHGYTGFNLLFGNRQEIHYFSNRGGSNGQLADGIHGLSNHLLNTPWPKVERLRQGVTNMLQDEPDEQRMLEILADRKQADDALLPDTGVGRETEKLLSAPFIVGDRYGTRASTVIIVHRDGSVLFIERNVNNKGNETDTNRFNFQLE